jgi:triacylglycerol lipase
MSRAVHRLRRAASGAGAELACLAAHVVLYPAGFLSERVREETERYSLDGLSPVRRGQVIGDVEATATPILLVHGLVDNRSVFTVLRRALQRRGFGRVRTVNYSPFTSDIRDAARVLGRYVEALCEQTGYDRLHVIAHSMGGMIARYYVQRLGGDARVHTLVTLGSPHGGTRAAHLLPLPILRQLRPGSDVVAELARPAYECRTRFVAVWTNADQLMYPKSNAKIDHPDLMARNVLLPDAGHFSLPMDRRVVREVVQTLTYLHTDGSTATPAVTSIDAAPSGGPAGSTGSAVSSGRPSRARLRRSARYVRIDDDEGRSGTGLRPLG